MTTETKTPAARTYSNGLNVSALGMVFVVQSAREAFETTGQIPANAFAPETVRKMDPVQLKGELAVEFIRRQVGELKKDIKAHKGTDAALISQAYVDSLPAEYLPVPEPETL